MIALCNYMSANVGKHSLRGRMIASFATGGFNGRIELSGEESGYPSQEQLNYGFKSYALEHARTEGADMAIWADCNMVLCQGFSHLLGRIEQAGVFLMRNAGWKAGQWTHDRCLQEFGVSREDAYKIPTVVSGFIAFDFRQKCAVEFFERFKAYCRRPEIINGPRYVGGALDVNNHSYIGHRHDQSILSLMAHTMGVPLLEGLYADPTNAVGVPPEHFLPVTDRTLITWLP